MHISIVLKIALLYLFFSIEILSQSQSVNFYFDKRQITTNEKTVVSCKQLLEDQLKLPIDLVKKYDRTSPHATYLTFVQTYNGIEIFGTQIKQAVDKRNIFIFINGSIYDTRLWRINTQYIPTKRISFHLAKQFGLPEGLIAQPVVYVQTNNVPEIAYKYTYQSKTDRSQITILCGYDNVVYSIDDHRMYNTISDSLVSGKVFSPDPITSGNTVYGGEFSDNNDADNISLNSARISVTFKAHYEDDTFYLKNNNIVIKDIGSPLTSVVTSVSPFFDFTRSQAGFEDVNTFYHLTNFANYIYASGFTELINFYIEVDPHGASGADQSFFVGGIIPSIQLGEGGVDDAEDADVIIHEYAHALSHRASPGSNSGFERRAADEGFGDYLAASYSRQFSDYDWGNVFNWDGHNEFWSGRQVNTNKVYPADVESPDIYKTGEIWSSALMDIYSLLGKEITDKIVFESMYGSFINMSLPDAATNLLNAENIIFDGIYQSIVYAALEIRGLANATLIQSETYTNPIQIFNTLGFTYKNEELSVILPEIQNTIISIFNLQGQLVESQFFQNTKIITYLPSIPTPGIYLLNVQGELSSMSIEILKTN